MLITEYFMTIIINKEKYEKLLENISDDIKLTYEDTKKHSIEY